MSSDDFPQDALPVWPPPEDSVPPGAIQAERPPGFLFPWQRPGLPHPGFWWSVLWCVVFLLCTQIPGGVIAVVVFIFLMILRPDMLPAGEMGNMNALMVSPAMSFALAVGLLFTEVLVIGFSWLALRLLVGRDWPRQCALRRPGLAHLLLVLASLPALMLFANFTYQVLRILLRVPRMDDAGLPGMEKMAELFGTWPWPFAVLVIGVGPGIGEELWCRAFLGRGLVGNFGWIGGVILTSFFFGLIHVDPCQGTMAMLMGLWLHFVYLTTRSLWMPILLHFLNNSLSVLSVRLDFLNALDLPLDKVGWHLPAATLAALLAVGWALYQSRSRIEGGFWRPANPGVEYPPEESGARVVHPMPSLAAILVALAGLAAFGVSLGITVAK
jgi:membrane protease YdiL (CAAX protease family)